MDSIVVAAAALACPVGMGLMMWLMGRGARGTRANTRTADVDVDALRAEHRRLGEEIERLGADREPARSRHA